jgi:hypothetical protein
MGRDRSARRKSVKCMHIYNLTREKKANLETRHKWEDIIRMDRHK